MTLESVNFIGFSLVANRLRKTLRKFIIVNPKVSFEWGSILTTMSSLTSSDIAVFGFPKERSMMSLSLS